MDGDDAAPQHNIQELPMFSLIALYFAYRNQTVGAQLALAPKTLAANDRIATVELAKAA
jgi:hypothetical protein